MKEKKISNQKIINTLIKTGFIEIAPICDECCGDLVTEILHIFGSANFNVIQVEDNIYSLRISV